MDADNLRDLVKRYEENRQFITNEETAKMALVAPFVRHPGYDPNNPREVRRLFARGAKKSVVTNLPLETTPKPGTTVTQHLNLHRFLSKLGKFSSYWISERFIRVAFISSCLGDEGGSTCLPS